MDKKYNPVKDDERYKVIKHFMDIAPKTLQEDGYHDMILLGIRDKTVNFINIQLEDKNDTAYAARKVLMEINADSCLLIVESFGAMFESQGASNEFIESGMSILDLERKMEMLSMSWEIKTEDNVVRGHRVLQFTRDDEDNIVLGEIIETIVTDEELCTMPKLRFVGLLS